ncbi:hypothetical protein ACCO45_007724 [Purpureocillium lilacinum]|uniref:Uncharacterized protein n=1 Tax=Purpureocillium lilacinum TaxID=33203 RepID=A0ACC4DNY6_PURLI
MDNRAATRAAGGASRSARVRRGASSSAVGRMAGRTSSQVDPSACGRCPSLQTPPRACQGKQGWLLPMSLVAPRSAVWASANQACVLRECFVRILKKIPGLMIVDENGKRRGSEGRGREEKQAGLGPEAYDTRDRGFGRNLERGGADPPTYLALLLLSRYLCRGDGPLGWAGDDPPPPAVPRMPDATASCAPGETPSSVLPRRAPSPCEAARVQRAQTPTTGTPPAPPRVGTEAVPSTFCSCTTCLLACWEAAAFRAAPTGAHPRPPHAPPAPAPAPDSSSRNLCRTFTLSRLAPRPIPPRPPSISSLSNIYYTTAPDHHRRCMPRAPPISTAQHPVRPVCAFAHCSISD